MTLKWYEESVVNICVNPYSNTSIEIKMDFSKTKLIIRYYE